MTKRETFLFVVYLHPLPRSKRKMEGVFSLSTHHHHHHHHSSLARNSRQRGWFLCWHTHHHHHPSLARNARRRGVSSVNTPTPPLLKLQDGGVLCRHATITNPFLAWNARRRGVPFVNTPSTPPSLEMQDGGGGFSVDTPTTITTPPSPPPPTPLSLELAHHHHHHPMITKSFLL